MKEEILLKQKFGNNRPFKVPEGYFDSFEKKMMQSVFETEVTKKTSVKRTFMRPLRWAACLTAVLIISGGVIYFNRTATKSNLNQVSHMSENIASSNSDYILDEISDYAMLDNDDFYSYITNE